MAHDGTGGQGQDGGCQEVIGGGNLEVGETMSVDYRRATRVAIRVAILSLEKIRELRHAVSALEERQNRLEGRAIMSGGIDGVPGKFSVSLPPDWDGEEPLILRVVENE